MVRTLVIGNWGFNPYQAIGEVFKHTLPDSGYIREAVRRLGVSGLEEQIFRDLERGDCRPLMSVLLHLYIQPKVLFGTGETTDASFSQPLKETLPPCGSALQHLTIDCISGNNLLAVLDVYSDPRENILLNRTLPALKALRLEADTAHLEELKPEPGWEAFRVSLENAGVAVSFDHGDYWHPRHAVIVWGRLPRGGTCPALWKESFEMQEQGKIRWEEVRDLIDLRDYSEYSSGYY
jgi:hypothetical protein